MFVLGFFFFFLFGFEKGFLSCIATGFYLVGYGIILMVAFDFYGFYLVCIGCTQKNLFVKFTYFIRKFIIFAVALRRTRHMGFLLFKL